MPDTITIPHPPAVKVAGRRRSNSTKHKPGVTHGHGEHQASGVIETENTESTDGVDDYPRPAPPGEGQTQHDGHHQYEEEPKKEKKHPSNEKMKEYAYWKAETTRPTRDAQSNTAKAYGAGGRIAQPAGRGI